MATKKDLHTLIRLREWEVDEKRRAMAVLLRQEEEVIGHQQALAAEIEAEKAYVGQAAPDQRLTFAAYLRQCGEKRERLATLLKEVRRQVEVMRDELADAYRRLKTFEVTQEQRDIAEEKEISRLDQIDLDEIGLNVHRQKVRAEAPTG